jgi:hypothetical protein
MEEGENIFDFLGKIEEGRSELINLRDNTFTNDTIMAKVLS